MASNSAGEREKKMPGPHGTEDTIDRARTHHRVKLSEPEDALVFDGTDVPVRYLLNHVDRMYNLFALLEDHPQVSPEQALAGIREHVKAEIPAHSDVASRPPHTERGSCRIEVPRFERPSQSLSTEKDRSLPGTPSHSCGPAGPVAGPHNGSTPHDVIK